jgi:hypothetical protein
MFVSAPWAGQAALASNQGDLRAHYLMFMLGVTTWV